jgi:hypothetical protein
MFTMPFFTLSAHQNGTGEIWTLSPTALQVAR